MNKVILSGYAGKDPDVRYQENGSKVARFTLATNEVYTDKDNNVRESTTWHKIVCWAKNADYAEAYVRKGRFVLLEGKICYREWEDRTGKTHEAAEIYVTDISCHKIKEEQPSKATPPSINITIPEPDDGLPF